MTHVKPEDQSQTAAVPRTTGAFLRWVLMRIIQTRRWWLMPFWVLLLAVALVLFLTGNGALLPAIYMAF